MSQLLCGIELKFSWTICLWWNLSTTWTQLVGYFMSRHFLGDHRRLTGFDSLFLFTTELFNFLGKGKKSSKYPFERDLGSGVSYI